MKTQHTPGSWRIGDAGTTIFGPKTDEPSPVTIAHIAPGNRTTKVERQANARLIAAAPELLKALEDLSEIVDWLIQSGNVNSPIEPHPYGCGVILASQQARSVLARARGE